MGFSSLGFLTMIENLSTISLERHVAEKGIKWLFNYEVYP